MTRLVAVALLSRLVALSASAQDHSMEPKSASRLTIHFFADVVGEKAWGSIAAPSTFNLGALDLFVHAQPAPEFYLLTEVAFEPTVQDYTLDVERMEAGWSPRSWFQATIGRYHTPLGYWNTAFHHGKTKMARCRSIRSGSWFTARSPSLRVLRCCTTSASAMAEAPRRIRRKS